MDQLVNFIIRPPRADYSPKNDLLDQEFMLKGRWFQRKDLEVTNGRGNKLKCSHYVPLAIPDGKIFPCVIYCHGNSGCRADASEAAIILLPSNITVFTLDFSGSGLSEGEHVSLGWNEKDDLKAVVNHLRTDGNVSCIGLWGRSMGAMTSLMYGAEDPSIAGMVLDSPFSNLVDLMMELVDTYKYPLPKFTVKLAIQHMRKIIKKKANFDIMDLDAIQVAKCCFVPALLGHAIDDDFIRPHHSDRIHDAYAGDKNIIKFDGDHNSPRPQFYFDSITIFFHNVLNPPKDVFNEHYSHVMQDFFAKDHWGTMHEAGYSIQSVVGPSSANSQEDALTQLRSRRPMSRTEVPPDISTQGKKFGAEMQEIGGECDHNPSSSRQSGMDHPNGYWHSSLIPSTTDDEYVEYSFDSLSDIPCSMEDEERMFMEAVIESLKDLEVRHSLEEDIPPPVGISSLDSSGGTKVSTTGAKGPSETVPVGTRSLDSSNGMKVSTTGTNGPSETVGNSISESVGCAVNLDPALHASGSCTTDSASTKESASTSNSTSSSVDCSSSTPDSDMAAGTRARLVVQKGPASHIIDGLTHRWGLNFFKNSR